MSNIVRFGPFEVDVARAELRKAGLRLRLQEQPFQVLAALLERPGEIVGREELVSRLWPDGTVVDFDRGLNAAVTRLRQVLSDSAETPRYVETVARRGYRFIGAIENARESPPATSASAPPSLMRNRSKLLVAAVASVVLVGGIATWGALNGNQRHELGASLKTAPLTAATGVEVNPSFSPDGAQIVYEWERDGRRHIYLKVVGSGDPVPLTSGDGAEYGPVWSPDGTSIAFIGQQQNAWGIYVIAPVGGTARRVAAVAGISEFTRARPYRRLDWAKDNHHVIVSVFGQAIWESLLLVSIDTGQKVWLTAPNEDRNSGDREPAVSLDGTKVAFARGGLNSERLYILPLTTDLRPAGPPAPIEAAGWARGPAWMANGRELIFTTLEPEVITSFALSWIDLVSGKKRHLVALGARAATPAISSRGSVAYSTIHPESTFWRQDIPTPREPALAPIRVTGAAAFQGSPEYSPDGSRVAFSSERSGMREIWNCASDGLHCLQITSMGSRQFIELPRWSPDGKQIVFGSRTGAIWDSYIVDANGGAPRRLTTDGPHGATPYWSHGAKWIYYSSVDSGRYTIWKTSAAGGKATQATHRGHVVIDSFDSKNLYYSEGGKLFRSAADGAGETELLNDLAWSSFAVGRDRIYYIHEDGEGVNEIRQFVLSSGENSRVVRIDKPLTNGLSLSPDGKSLLFAEIRRRSNLMIAKNLY
jgi:Tol biopolymer transport system component/DNA-binding winged helix-turn-helix (wHTH) protein